MSGTSPAAPPAVMHPQVTRCKVMSMLGELKEWERMAREEIGAAAVRYMRR